MIAQVAQVTQVTDILSPEVATEIGLYIFILGGFLGYHLITRVPPLLHTPLMSATNAIAGISLVGSLVVAGADYGPLSTVLGFIAVTCSSTNVVGGFLITDRMLKMFKTSKDQASGDRVIFTGRRAIAASVLLIGGLALLVYLLRPHGDSSGTVAAGKLTTEALRYSYILSAALFILGLKGLSSPRYARRGMILAAIGMLMAVVGTLFHHEIVNYTWI